MRTEPLSYDDESPIAEPVEKAAGIAHKIGIRLFHEVREALPPTIFFFCRLQFHRAHDESPRRAVSRRGKQLHARDYGGASCGKGGLGRQQNPVFAALRPRAAYT